MRIWLCCLSRGLSVPSFVCLLPNIFWFCWPVSTNLCVVSILMIIMMFSVSWNSASRWNSILRIYCNRAQWRRTWQLQKIFGLLANVLTHSDWPLIYYNTSKYYPQVNHSINISFILRYWGNYCREGTIVGERVEEQRIQICKKPAIPLLIEPPIN